jgi:predicted nicotinamide N-methyase
MTTTKKSEHASFVEANTFVGAPSLCPELRLRFLREDAPLKETAPLWREAPHIFDWEGPRPYWAFAWGGGQALARFVLDNPKIVAGKKVLDFGSGSGIAAIAAAKAGAATVTATDIDPVAIEATKLNARLNDVVITAIQATMAESSQQQCDVLLAGDVFYLGFGSDAHWFFDWALEGRLILIGEPPERGFPKEYLQELIRYTIRTFPDWEHHSIRQACVYQLPPNAKFCRIPITKTNEKPDEPIGKQDKEIHYYTNQ